MPASKKRKGRGSGVPLSVRQHGSIEDQATRSARNGRLLPLVPGRESMTQGLARERRARDAGGKPASAAPIARTASPTVIRGQHAARPSHLRRNVAIGAGVVGAAAGTGYLVHRHNQKKAAMSKSLDLVNPFEEVVAFGKAYPLNTVSGTNVRRIRALVPTGRHVGRANALTHVTNSSGGGGRNATRLERYTTKPRGQRSGPFGKAAGFGGAASRQFAAGVSKPSVKNGIRMIQDMPKLKTLPAAATRRNSNIPDGARRGSSLSRV